MKLKSITKPDFLIIGAQRTGTTWLWSLLKQHPGTDLPKTKEIHYFGGVEKYQLGREWYYKHFENLNPSKIIGEASSTYFYDYLPYWHNASKNIEFNKTLPVIPELVTNELKDIKIIVILRDPVMRAISGYKFWLRKGNLSPKMGLKKAAIETPKRRILEYGFYGRYLKEWKRYIPNDRMRILIYEDDVVKSPDTTIKNIFEFLGLDPNFRPANIRKPVHKSWSYSQILVNYYGGQYLSRKLGKPLVKILKNITNVEQNLIKKEDIEFLQSEYLPEKNEIEILTQNKLNNWNYGVKVR